MKTLQEEVKEQINVLNTQHTGLLTEQTADLLALFERIDKALNEQKTRVTTESC